MVLDKGQPAIPNSQKKKKKAVQAPEIVNANPPAASENLNVEAKLKAKGHGSGHNCPKKDIAKTHVFTARCIVKSHAGYCPACNHLVSFTHGCAKCKIKGTALLKNLRQKPGDSEKIPGCGVVNTQKENIPPPPNNHQDIEKNANNARR